MSNPESQRYPTLTDAGMRMLRRLREHPAAPIYRNQSGNKLTPEDLAALADYERRVLDARIGWPQEARPDWLDAFVEQTWRDVPHWHRQGERPAEFTAIPTSSRADLAADITAFVPDPLPLARMIAFDTSGTTGHPLIVPSHPLVAGRYLAHHKRALARFGITPRAGAGEVGVILLGFQLRCFTYVSVTPSMDESGLAKINLHPDDWRNPDDRARYLDAMAPEFLAGDPISFGELLRLPMRHRPRALLSVSMQLTAGLRAELERRYGCPVLDLYSMNEAGPIAVFDPERGGHVLLQDRLFVETLDTEGRPVPAGERGEITLTGGFNFCLPLLRYRTGDWARLDLDGPEPMLRELEGRAPVRFRHADGSWRNNVDVSHALAHLPLTRFTLHQAADGSLLLRLPEGSPHASQAASALARLLGQLPLQTRAIDPSEGKLRQYTSALD
ncbi:hypothetical protein [Thermomonas sp.]|uniref:hypothetical protein n=1 Tax=Thermomonas sp. TaxID=1971895 RepID=UPI00262977BA|nr:hypothetical protein [Thermomonas sp.]